MGYNPFFNIDNPELMGYEYSWITFMKTDKINEDILPQPVAKSWVRCKQKQLRLDGREIKTEQATRVEHKHRKFLMTYGSRLIRDILEKIDSDYFYGVITDIHGVKIVGVQSEKYILSESLKKISEINDFSEDILGTNCFSIVSDIRKPFCVAGALHYFEPLHKYAGYAAPIFDLDDEMIGMVGLFTVTEKMGEYILSFVTAMEKAIENSLKWAYSRSIISQQNEEKKYLLDTVSDGVVYVDAEGKITYGNRKFFDLFGKTEEELIGKSILSLKVKPTAKELQKLAYSTRYFTKDTEICILGKRNTAMTKECFFNKYKILDVGEGNKNEVWTFTVYSDIQKRAQKLNLEHFRRFTFDDIKSNSNTMKLAIDLAKKAASFETRTIIEGDSGTGKEMFAQAIHSEGPRKNGPFIAVDCGALPSGLLESELFGYEEGAFTGSRKGGKKGKFELADKGVLFLDEITNMPFDMQAKLLRILQDGRLIPIGGTKLVDIDVQVIAATNKDIVAEIEKGNFRKDLFYRLNIIHIKIPSLRDRKNDVMLFLGYFMKKYNPERTKRLSREAIEILNAYDWPGNVRQLENVIERMIIISDDAIIGKEYIPDEILSTVLKTGITKKFAVEEKKTLLEMNKDYVRNMVAYCNGNIKNAAEILDISRVTVYKYLKD